MTTNNTQVTPKIPQATIMKTFKLTFEIVQSEKKPSKYLVICDEMNYEAWTNKPQDIVDGLVNEWFDLGMGDE